MARLISLYLLLGGRDPFPCIGLIHILAVLISPRPHLFSALTVYLKLSLYFLIEPIKLTCIRYFQSNFQPIVICDLDLVEGPWPVQCQNLHRLYDIQRSTQIFHHYNAVAHPSWLAKMLEIKAGMLIDLVFQVLNDILLLSMINLAKCYVIKFHIERYYVIYYVMYLRNPGVTIVMVSEVAEFPNWLIAAIMISYSEHGWRSKSKTYKILF